MYKHLYLKIKKHISNQFIFSKNSDIMKGKKVIKKKEKQLWKIKKDANGVI